MPSKHLATGSSPVGCIINPIPKKMGFLILKANCQLGLDIAKTP